MRFSIQMFSCWDFKIANEETANNKIASIATSFRETILEDEESGKQNKENIWSTRLLRLTASLLVFGFLGGSGWIIYDIVMVVKFKEACLKVILKNERVCPLTSFELEIAKSAYQHTCLFSKDISTHW